ncbi:hypothetical protein RMSM_03662 [Rhodopirellula maiorica SM1]|uniref:Uncharacterized protein n=1 Tax=Rhodopirellula maiorica SM1 TaxID=1265738 RepID=M5RVJ1_9BACT|nr:hypothetical protein RMSM_03662 [Rhodopirellula maiorica SM1]
MNAVFLAKLHAERLGSTEQVVELPDAPRVIGDYVTFMKLTFPVTTTAQASKATLSSKDRRSHC